MLQVQYPLHTTENVTSKPCWVCSGERWQEMSSMAAARAAPARLAGTITPREPL